MILRQTIYVDVLAAVNFFINYFLLLACAKFLSLPAKRGRLAAAAGIGAVFSLSILLPELPAAASLGMKLLMSAVIVLCAFGWHSARQFFRCTAAFYIISFGFAGVMLALWYFLAPQGLLVRNSVVYFNISPLLLIVLTVVCYLIITLINRITGRQAPKELFCNVTVSIGSASCSFQAKVDTGNALREPFSDYPAVVVNREAIEHILPQKDSLNFRLIPFQAVSGSGVLKAFRPDRLTVSCRKNTIRTNHVYIAISETRLEGCDALLNSDLLQQSPDQIRPRPGAKCRRSGSAKGKVKYESEKLDSGMVHRNVEPTPSEDRRRWHLLHQRAGNSSSSTHEAGRGTGDG